MFECRRVQGLLAQSLYEPLNDADDRLLKGHVERCETCRAEARSLRAMVDVIPRDTVPLDRDLAPVLRARMAEPAAAERFAFPRPAFAAAAVAAIAVVVAGIAFQTQQSAPRTPGSEYVAMVSPFEAIFAVADRYIQNGDAPEAYLTLASAVEDHGDDPLAGEARLKMADLAFERLRWYPEAYAAYDTLRSRNADVWQANARCFERYELLAESRTDDYAPLHTLDAAKLNGRFESFENVISRYPANYVAALAADEMARIAGEDAGRTDDRVLAMESAKARCTNPLAVARLNLELGHLYRDVEANPDKARMLYEEAEHSGDGRLAQLAAESSRSLDANR